MAREARELPWLWRPDVQGFQSLCDFIVWPLAETGNIRAPMRPYIDARPAAWKPWRTLRQVADGTSAKRHIGV